MLSDLQVTIFRTLFFWRKFFPEKKFRKIIFQERLRGNNTRNRLQVTIFFLVDRQSCQMFHGRIYRNGENIQNDHKIYQIVTKYTICLKMFTKIGEHWFTLTRDHQIYSRTGSRGPRRDCCWPSRPRRGCSTPAVSGSAEARDGFIETPFRPKSFWTNL
jgi:hypothetical protein